MDYLMKKTNTSFTKYPLILLLSFVLIFNFPGFGQEKQTPEKLKVGLRNSPPFIMPSDMEYSGISVDLWEEIASNLELDYEYVSYSNLGKMLKDIENGKVDICINPLTVTSDRLTRFAFTQPYYISGMAIALKVKSKHGIISFLKNLFSVKFLQVVLMLFAVIFIFGFLIWLVERRNNKQQFGGGIKGLGHGIWWSAVTMTTVGYGDKAPTTGAGRFISIIWMFTAVIIISSFTASISAALTYNKFKTDIRSLQDLRNAKVGTVQSSSTASYLSESHIKYKSYATLKEAMADLQAGKLDAVVYDEPILSYLLHSEGLNNDIELIPSGSNSVYFGFASRNLELLHRVNPYLFDVIEGKRWRKMLESYNLRLD